MLKKVLIANRGEIAVRIIRECLDSSIEAVSVYSTADSQALHRIIASRSVCIGGPRAAESYLNINNIIEAAKGTGCDAVHPGFGFLSENSGHKIWSRLWIPAPITISSGEQRTFRRSWI